MTREIKRFRAETNPNFGSEPEKRKIEDLLKNSLLCFDKKKKPSTHQLAQKTKEILGIDKVGHAGQLEPPMTGLVVIILDKACKLSSSIIKGDREYRAQVSFKRPLSETQIKRAVKKFTGKIKQVPPLRSRMRRVLRTRMVHEIKIEEFDKRKIQVYVRCEAGTYLRKLFYDMGRLLRTKVTLSKVRRVGIGHLSLDQTTSLKELQKAYQAWKEEGDEELLRSILIPVEKAVEGKSIYIQDSAVYKVCCGAPIFLEDVVKLDSDIGEEEDEEEEILVKTLKGEIIGMATPQMTSEEMEENIEGIAALPNRIAMSADTYRMTNSEKVTS